MMNQLNQRITLAITGASGIQYGLRLLECLLKADKTVHLLISKAACKVAELELGINLPSDAVSLKKYFIGQYGAHDKQLILCDANDWTAPIASGSNCDDAMVICPCSSGTLAAIAHGISDNLIERAADVMLKERKPLILVHRETPLSQLHLENMLTVTRFGATVLPASPGFYHRPQNMMELIDFVIARILDHLKIPHQLMNRWGDSEVSR